MAPAERDFEKKATLSGYGVALDLKKTDYLALDDRHLGEKMFVRLIYDSDRAQEPLPARRLSTPPSRVSPLQKT